jgi:TolB protein
VRLLAAGLLALALWGASASPAAAPRPAPRILFVADAGSSNLYVVARDGTHRRRITATGANEIEPDVAPDGRTAVAVSERQGSYGLVLVDLGSGVVTPLTTGSADRAPSWSPDGQRIAFARSGDIELIRPDGTGLEPLTTGAADDEMPAWSPEGSRIAFIRDGSLALMGASGAGLRVVADTGYDEDKGYRAAEYPSWTLDGQRIALDRSFIYVGGGALVTVDAATGKQEPIPVGSRGIGGPTDGRELRWALDGSAQAWQVAGIVMIRRGTAKPRALTPDWDYGTQYCDDPPYWATSPHFLPDGDVLYSGRALAGQCEPGLSTSRLFGIDPVGSGLPGAYGAAGTGWSASVDRAPEMAPNGKLIAFSYSYRGANGVATIRPDGAITGGFRTTGPPADLAWAPDSRHLAIALGGAIWIADARTGHRRRLVRDAESPAWSPDGAAIAFDRPHTTCPLWRQGTLMTVRPDGSHLRRVAAGIDPDWSPDSRSLVYARDFSVYTRRLGSTGSRLLAAAAGFPAGSLARACPHAPRPTGVRPRFFARPRWSPAGGLIALMEAHDLEAARTRLRSSSTIAVISPRGTGLRQLELASGPVTATDPSWTR